MKKRIIKYPITLFSLLLLLFLLGCNIQLSNSPSYTVNFYVDGKIVKSEIVKLSEAASVPEAPSKHGFTFKGWSSDYTKIENDLNVYANFEPIKYLVTYQNDGSMINNPTYYTILDEITLLAPSKEGYQFLGWYQDEVLINKIAKGTTGDITLTARYELNTYQYKVEYYFENILDNDYSFNHFDNYYGQFNEVVNAEIKSFDGFTFNESFHENIVSGTLTLDTLVLKLYYSRNEYKLIIDNDGGEGPNEITAKYESKLNAPFVTKENYTFSHWEPSFPSTMPLNGFSVKAIWIAGPSCQINFETYGGTLIDSQNVFINQQIKQPIDPIKAGYTFRLCR